MGCLPAVLAGWTRGADGVGGINDYSTILACVHLNSGADPRLCNKQADGLGQSRRGVQPRIALNRLVAPLLAGLAPSAGLGGVCR